MRTALAVLLGLAAVLTAAVAPAAAHTTTTTSFCGPYQEYRVTNFAAEPLIVRNDVFGADHECLTVYGHRFSKFTVTRSTASKRRGDAVAYPSIFYGCVWGTCSKGTVLPERAGRATRMRLTWLTRHVRPAGLWNTAYDIWFSKRRHVSGQAAGAELMIWLNAKFAPPWGRQTVRIELDRNSARVTGPKLLGLIERAGVRWMWDPHSHRTVLVCRADLDDFLVVAERDRRDVLLLDRDGCPVVAGRLLGPEAAG